MRITLTLVVVKMMMMTLDVVRIIGMTSNISRIVLVDTWWRWGQQDCTCYYDPGFNARCHQDNCDATNYHQYDTCKISGQKWRRSFNIDVVTFLMLQFVLCIRIIVRNNILKCESNVWKKILIQLFQNQSIFRRSSTFLVTNCHFPYFLT